MPLVDNHLLHTLRGGVNDPLVPVGSIWAFEIWRTLLNGKSTLFTINFLASMPLMGETVLEVPLTINWHSIWQDLLDDHLPILSGKEVDKGNREFSRQIRLDYYVEV